MSTNISWCTDTWNPITGCSKVSEGCRNCYASKLAPRLAAMGQKGYTNLPWTKQNAEQNVHLHPDRLEKPLHWKKSRRVFVNSMSDLFHELVPDEFIDKVFAVMALAPRHIFQVLTKRPERMAEYLGHEDRMLYVLDDVCRLSGKWSKTAHMKAMRRRLIAESKVWANLTHEWPLPNVHLGTSVEDSRVRSRVDHLRRVPAALRFLSCEPLIGPLDGLNLDSIGWVIAGGESGPGYRPMDPDWARSLRDQCVAADVPFFGKQASGPKNEMPLPKDLQIREMPDVH